MHKEQSVVPDSSVQSPYRGSRTVLTVPRVVSIAKEVRILTNIAQNDANDIKQTKKNLRNHFIQVRGALSGTQRQELDDALAGHVTAYLLGLGETSGLLTNGMPPIVAMYVAFKSEANITSCMEPLWRQGWRVVVPITDSRTKQLLFAPVTPDTVWRQGVLGISEPALPESDLLVPPEDIAVFCVPGLAFTAGGLRLGYGGGYYDRLFARDGVVGQRIGIAYNCQVTDFLPGEPHDVLMHGIATETGVQIRDGGSPDRQ